MKTTIELPDALLRRAKSVAAERGQPLKTLVIEALTEKLSSPANKVAEATPPWSNGFGALRRLRAETARIQADIDATFGVVDADDRT